MAKESVPEMTKLPQKDFKSFTATKNRLLKDMKSELDNENLLRYIRDSVSGALTEFLDILFEQAGLDKRIQEDEELKFLTTLDFTQVLCYVSTMIPKIYGKIFRSLKTTESQIPVLKKLNSYPSLKPLGSQTKN